MSELSCETSDEASENELLDRSLSVWRGWSAIEKEDFTPVPLDLHTACSIGQYDWVRSIISKNEGAATVDRKNKGGWTALMYACYIGHDNIVNLLVKAGCQMNKMKNPRGHTPLMLAASCGNENVARTLVRNGAELEVMDKSGWTALVHATYAGHQNFVAYLLEAGANINAVEPTTGLSPFMLAAAEGHEIIVQLFLQHGVNVHAKAYNGDMARSLALIKGYMKIVSLIDNHSMPASRLRSEPGLDFYLSSPGDDQQPRQLRGLGLAGQKKSKGPSIRDGPEAIARMIDRSRPDEMSLGTDMPTPKGYMSFSNTGAEKGAVSATRLSYRDVTSPINPDDYKDTSGDAEDFGDDSNAFSKTGAITIKSSSSSSGGLVAALGLSREGSLDSDDSRGYDPSHHTTEEDSSDQLDSSPDADTTPDPKDFDEDNDCVTGAETGVAGSSEVDRTGRKKLPLLKLPPRNNDEVGVESKRLSSDSSKEKPRAVVSPLRDYFPLDVSFPPDARGGAVGENLGQGLDMPVASVDPRQVVLDQAGQNASSTRVRDQQQQQPPRVSMSQSEIVQAYFNSMGGGEGNRGGGSGVTSQPQRQAGNDNNDERSRLLPGSGQQQQYQSDADSMNVRSNQNVPTNQVQSQNLPSDGKERLRRNNDGSSFMPIKDSSCANDVINNARLKPTHVASPQISTSNQQQQGIVPMSNPTLSLHCPPPPSSTTFPEEFVNDPSNRNPVSINQATSSSSSSSIHPEVASTGARTVSDVVRNPSQSFQQQSQQQQMMMMMAGNERMNNPGAGSHLPHPHHHQAMQHGHQQHPPPVSFQLPMSSPHALYRQTNNNINTNTYQNAAQNLIRHHQHPPPPSQPPPPHSQDCYAHHHHHQQQHQQPSLLPHPPSLPPPPLHHHYHHHHHHLQQQQQQQNLYNLFPQHNLPPPPPTMQNFGQHQHPHQHQPPQQLDHQPPISSYPPSSYLNFPQDTAYPSPLNQPSFDPASYYKTIPSDIYYSDMTTFSALHFVSDSDTKTPPDPHPDNIPSNPQNPLNQPTNTPITTTNANQDFVPQHENVNVESSNKLSPANSLQHPRSNQPFPSNDNFNLNSDANKTTMDRLNAEQRKSNQNLPTTPAPSSSLASTKTTERAIVARPSPTAIRVPANDSSPSSTVSNRGDVSAAILTNRPETMQGFSAFASVVELNSMSPVSTTVVQSYSSPSQAAAPPPSSKIHSRHIPSGCTNPALNIVSPASEMNSFNTPTAGGGKIGDPIPNPSNPALNFLNPAPNPLNPVLNSTPISVMLPGHTTSQPVSQSTGLLDQDPQEGTACKDLRQMLAQLGLGKYLEKFQEQDVDLQVFLSLTDNDLKEVGIKLLGPRKKMANAIARWHSQAPFPGNSLEQAYADRLEGEMQELAIQLNQAYASEERLKAQVLQEQQLRSVTESCLVEVRGHWERTRQTVEEGQGTMKTMGEALAKLRLSQKEIRKSLEGRGKSDASKHQQQQRQSQSQHPHKPKAGGDEREGTGGSSTGLDGGGGYSSSSAVVEGLLRKCEKYLKDVHKGLSSLAYDTDKVLTSSQDLSSLDKGLEEM